MPAATVGALRERTITLNGFSKAYAMTGWRVGYLCAPAELTDAALKIHQYVMLCAPHMGQVAALAALRSATAEKRAMVEEYRLRRNLIVAGLNRAGLACHVPEGAFYAFPSVESTGLSDVEFAERLLAEERVAVVPGSVFGEGGAGHLRCAYAVSREDLSEAVRRIERVRGGPARSDSAGDRDLAAGRLARPLALPPPDLRVPRGVADHNLPALRQLPRSVSR